MGCFSTCFRKSNRRRSNRSRRISRHPCLLDQLEKDDFLEPLQVNKSIIEQESVGKPVEPSTPESKDEQEEEKEKEYSSGRKKVTFDLNVRIYERLEDQTNKEEKEDENEEKEGTANTDSCHSDSSNSSSLFSYPPNHRYQNCRDSDDELASDASDMDDDDDYDYDDYLDNESEDDDDGEINKISVDNDHTKISVDNDQSSGSSSLFSLSLINQKFRSDANEVNSPMLTKNPSCKAKEIKSTAVVGLLDNQNMISEGERTKIVIDSVLNPVENLDQWKAVKARAKLTKNDQSKSSKENINEGGADPRNTITRCKVKSQEEEVATNDCQKVKSVESNKKEITVDTSLSSWLGGVSEAAATTPNSRASSAGISSEYCRRSPRKYEEDRPILGALTVEEIKQFSATSSPCRRSPSPDDMPIIGTVGSYWTHTGQEGSNSKSAGSVSSTARRIKYTEDAKVCWNPIPFETRLETALQKGIPQA